MARDKEAERLTKEADRRLAALDRSAHAPVKKAAAKKPKQQGNLALPVTIAVTGTGLAVWGWLNATTRPNGATLLGLVAAAAIVCVVTKTVRGYWVLEHQDEEHTEAQLENLQQQVGSLDVISRFFSQLRGFLTAAIPQTDDGAAAPGQSSGGSSPGSVPEASEVVSGPAPSSPFPRTFLLVRHVDISGVSGTGSVAEGCQFVDGSVALRWRGDNPATAVWPDLDSMLAVHGHQGATEIQWIDETPIPLWPAEGGTP